MSYQERRPCKTIYSDVGPKCLKCGYPSLKGGKSRKSEIAKLREALRYIQGLVDMEYGEPDSIGQLSDDIREITNKALEATK